MIANLSADYLLKLKIYPKETQMFKQERRRTAKEYTHKKTFFTQNLPINYVI